MAFSAERLASIAALDEVSFKRIGKFNTIGINLFQDKRSAEEKVETFKNALFTLIIMAARNAIMADSNAEAAEITLKMSLRLKDSEKASQSNLTIIPTISLGGLESGDANLGDLITLITATGLPCE